MVIEAHQQVKAVLPTDKCQSQSNLFEDRRNRFPFRPDSALTLRAPSKHDHLIGTGSWHHSFLDALLWRQLLSAAVFTLQHLIAGARLALETMLKHTPQPDLAQRTIST